MGKINLSALQLECLGGKIEVVNIRDFMSNTMFNQATRIPEKRLAEKLYDAEGEVELNEEECTVLKTFVNRDDMGFLLRLKEAVINSLDKE